MYSVHMAIQAAAEMQPLSQTSLSSVHYIWSMVAQALVHIDLGIVLPFHVIVS